MAVKRVLQYGEKTLREPSKEVNKVSKKIVDLVHDLLETMYAKNGVGLAAPQIGVNYRVFVIDVSTDKEPLNPLVFINPKIIKKSGAIFKFLSCDVASFISFVWVICLINASRADKPSLNASFFALSVPVFKLFIICLKCSFAC